MSTEPKPVKPLMAFAAAKGKTIVTWTIRSQAGLARLAMGAARESGDWRLWWKAAQKAGYRIIRVRIELVER